MNQYVLVSRKNTSDQYFTLFPKGSQRPIELKFFVKAKHFDMFPKRGLPMKAFELADFIFADGELVKSRF